MVPKIMEVNFDSLVGLTHNYGGLSFGNIASQKSNHLISKPKEAALQGLRKMKALADRGFKQAVLPPHQRPDIATLRSIGFEGSDTSVIKKASLYPTLLSNLYSASAMWAANAATVSPSCDTHDQKVHFTPANLISNLHRAIEATTTTKILKAIFSDKNHFIVHDPLPSTPLFSDEGAANHGRICETHSENGTEVFVYGKSALNKQGSFPKKFPARQTLEASQAIIRRHRLKNVLMLQQNPVAIDAGCFHNDVISVINENVLLYHEEAFVDPSPLLKLPINPIQIASKDLSLKDAVSTYLFNSQLLSKPDGSMLILAPQECEATLAAKITFDKILADDKNPINEVLYFDLKQSMQNGGGPACLRLRVVLTKKELNAVQGRVFLDDTLYSDLVKWVNNHYRDQLTPNDLTDPNLVKENITALEKLCDVMSLPSIYPFQLEG